MRLHSRIFATLSSKKKLGEKLFRTINRVLVDHGVTLSQGKIVDASLISAPSSSPSAEL